MDLINKLSEILDNNVRIVRYSAPILASIGIIIILRKTYAFSMFRTVHEIPKEIIANNWNLRGVVEGVVDPRTLSVKHVPILFKNLEQRERLFGEDAAPIHVAIAGIEPRSGCMEHLQQEVLMKKIRIVPLGISSDDELKAEVYLKKGLLSRSVCVNEDIVRQGLAVVDNERELGQSKAYIKLSRKLLTAEIYADKKGVGLWKRPSLWQRLKTRIHSLELRMPFRRKGE